jgi:hypothetical protein
MKASKTPTTFPIPTFSPKKSSTTSKPLSNNSGKSRRTWEGREWKPKKADLNAIERGFRRW